MRIPATVALLTFNSGRTLARALESVKEFDDLLLVDGGSTDDTQEIAARYGARIVLQDAAYKDSDDRLIDYGGARNQFIEHARYDWILYIDSDETVSPGLVAEIREAVGKDGPLVYRIPIRILLDGRLITHSTNYPGYQTRFFNRSCGARFVKKVHERLKLPDGRPIGTFTHPWYIHTTRSDWNHYLRETAAHRRREVLDRCRQPLSDYLSLALLRNLRVSFTVFVKAFLIYLMHGSRGTLPIRGELGRALSPLIVAWGLTACRFRLPGGIVSRP